MKKELKPIKLFDSFAGIGALHIALKRLKIPVELVGISEIDEQVTEAYCLMHNVDKSLNYGDISKIDPNELPDFDLFNFSFPCTDYTVAGKKKGKIDEEGNITNSGLYIYGINIIKTKKPKYIMIENVKNLIGKDFISDFYDIINQLDKIGYNCYYLKDKKGNPKAINSLDYNIPQNRERVYVICVRKDVDKDNFNFPEPIGLHKSLNDILEEDAELPILHNIYGGFKETKPRIFNEYSPTIRTAKGGGHIPSVCVKNEYINNNKYKVRNIQGYNIRQLSPLECFRLMDFPDDTYNKVKDHFKPTILYSLAGNSITVGVLEYIFKNLLNEYITEEIELHTYNDRLIKLPKLWTDEVTKMCFDMSIDEFLDNYTYDDTERILKQAKVCGLA